MNTCGSSIAAWRFEGGATGIPSAAAAAAVTNGWRGEHTTYLGTGDIPKVGVRFGQQRLKMTIILDPPSIPGSFCIVTRLSIAHILFKCIDFIPDFEGHDIWVCIVFFMFQLKNCR
jgi:hypothetical protein